VVRESSVVEGAEEAASGQPEVMQSPVLLLGGGDQYSN
jgi:hypothetical protein